MMNSKQSFLLLLFFATFFLSCRRDLHVKNKIIFKDRISDVRDSLLKMQKLVRKLPTNIDGFNTNYEINDKNVIINNVIGRSEDSAVYYTRVTLGGFDTNEQTHFISLAKYLKANYITAAYIDKQTNLILYIYRDSPHSNFDDSRDLVLQDGSTTGVLEKSYKILDKQYNVLLIAPNSSVSK